MKMTPPMEGGTRETLVLALPIVVSQACETAIVFTNRMFLSELNPELMNAAMAGGVTALMMVSFVTGLVGYATALVAQYLGAGYKSKCPEVITQAFFLCLAIYPIVLACRPLAYAVFDNMHLASEQLEPQKLYFDILLFGALIPLFRGCLASFFSGIGRTSIVMIASCVAMLVNAGINYLLVLGHFGFPSLGIRGAAYGALTGSASGLLILLIAYLRKKNRTEFNIMQSFHFSSEVIRKLLRYGSPTGLEMFSAFLSYNAIVLIFHSCGAVTATAATIMLNWDMVSFVPLIGFEIAVTSLVGRYMGARRPDFAHNSVISGMKLGQLYSVIILVLFLFFPAMLVNIFRPTEGNDIFLKAQPTAIWMLRAASIYILTNAAFVVFIGALRGAGDTFWAMALAITAHWTMVVALAGLLKVAHLSPEAGWLSIIAVFLIFFGLVCKRYFDGKWKTLHIIETHEPVAS